MNLITIPSITLDDREFIENKYHLCVYGSLENDYIIIDSKTNKKLIFYQLLPVVDTDIIVIECFYPFLGMSWELHKAIRFAIDGIYRQLCKDGYKLIFYTESESIMRLFYNRGFKIHNTYKIEN